MFIVTDGSQDYQTQWANGWGSQNWTANATVPYQNSATIMPPNSESNTNYCQTMKNRGITIAVLYIPYSPIVESKLRLCQQRRRLRQRQHRQYSYIAAELRLAELFLYRQHPDRHSECAD